MVRPLLGLACLPLAFAASCPDESLDLCDGIDPYGGGPAGPAATTNNVETEADGAVQSGTPWFAISLAIAGFGGRGLVLSALLGEAAGATDPSSTCGDLSFSYKSHDCCGQPETEITSHQLVPFSKTYQSTSKIIGANPCNDAAVKVARPNQKCLAESIANAVDAAAADLDAIATTGGDYPMGPQSGGDVTKGFEGGFDTAQWYKNETTGELLYPTGIVPVKGPFHKGAGTKDGNAGLGPLCPVNVHWHLGAEHRSAGEYDENGKSPGRYEAAYNKEPLGEYTAKDPPRRLAGDPVRYGFACKKYDADDQKFNLEYKWRHCTDMFVGETYEVHWPHSVLGACNTPYQYQSKFYDGIFCRYEAAGSPDLSAQQVASNVGVQSQVFTIVNDEAYYYPDLIKGMIVTETHGRDLAIYAGSSTGTGRDNNWCSMYTPITWQVDRKCHLISASSFDKMCADMKQNADNMEMDIHPHGARELVYKVLNAKEQFDADHGDSGNGGHQQVPR